MHVLLILKFSPAFGGGMVEHLRALGQRLQSDRVRLTYAFPRRRPWFDQLAPFGDVLEVPEILSPWHPAFTRMVGERRPDIVHIHFSFALALALSVPAFQRTTRIVYHWHNVPRALFGSEAVGLHLRRTAAGCLARFGDRRIGRHLAVSREILDLLVRHHWTRPEKIEHQPNAIRLPAGLAPGSLNGSVIIGTVANFRRQKDHETLLRAFQHVGRDHPEARLELVGDGPTRPEMEELARTLQIADRVTFRGTVIDAAPCYRGFDIFALATHHEGHPLSLLEAMSHGLPFVATEVPSVREVVPNGFEDALTPARDPSALAAALSKLINMGPEGRRQIGIRAREVVRAQFRMEAWTDHVLAVYRSLSSE